jgi:hypothetical protein
LTLFMAENRNHGDINVKQKAQQKFKKAQGQG